MSDSTELRRIVGALNLPWECESWWSQNDRDRITLANHADALVALVEACERWSESDGRESAGLLRALSAVHATKAAP